MKIKRWIGFSTAFLLGLAVLGGFVWAQQSTLDALGATISPTSAELVVNPGEQVKKSVRITNQTNQTITYKVSPVDFRVVGTEGAVSVEQTDDPKSSAWFSLSPTQFTLAAGANRKVDYVINVPPNAEPGGHFVSILFEPQTDSDISGPGAAVIQRVGSLVLMRVSGNITEKARIQRLVPKSYVGTWTEATGTDGKTKILIPTDEQLNQEQPKRYFSKGPVGFDLFVKNEGNVHVKPAGTLKIKDLFGREVKVALDPRNVFPGGERRSTAIWPTKWLWGIYYTAEVTALYGDTNQVMMAKTSFWGFPLPALLAVVGLTLFVLLLRKRLSRAIKVLVKGSD